MKLYHKNTDIEVKIGDVFHLSGRDWLVSYINLFAAMVSIYYSSKDHIALAYVIPNELGMEWR